MPWWPSSPKSYVTGDAFAGGFHADLWADHEIKFKPGQLNGQPVKSVVLLPIVYK